MAELGDSRIDLLKLDVEGGEYTLVPALDLDALGVKVLAIQLHYNGTVPEARAWSRRFGEQGDEPVASARWSSSTFVRRDRI